MKLCAGRLAAALMCAFVVFSASAGNAPRWLEIKSTNFELFTTAGERSGREVVRHFEQVRAFFLEALGLGVKSGPPVRIVVFKSDKDFAPYAPNEVVAAFYLGAADRDYIVMKGAWSESSPVAVHEYIHLLVKHSGIAVPVWFNEGLAELYSNLKPVGAKVEVGDLIMPHLLLLRQSKWIDLPALLAVQQESALYNVKNQAPLFYAESWALVHMLYLADDYRPKLTSLLAGIKTGGGMIGTFQKAYGKSMEQIEKDLRSYTAGRSFNASRFNIRLAQADEPEASAASPLEIDLVLANILANSRSKAAAGREEYDRLARDNPRDARIEEGLAALSWREQKMGEAERHYAKAAELGSTNAKMYLDYGRLLRAKNKSAEAAVMLKRATEIEPGDRQAHLELGYAYVVNDQHFEALEQFQLSKPVPPAQAFEYLHAVAYAYYRLDRKTEAKTTAAACRAYAKTTDQVERLNQLVTALNYEPQQVAASQEDPPPARSQPMPPRAPVQERPKLPLAEGTLKQIDCTGGKIRMRISAGDKTLSFTIGDPGSIVMKDNAAMDFTCGPQRQRRIRIEYDAKPDRVLGTSGVIRSIEFPQ
jgi:tetratricopeptide (TPR) repeat protein